MKLKLYRNIFILSTTSLLIFAPASKGTTQAAIELNNAGVAALNKQKWSTAIEKFRKALKLDSDYHLARKNLAIAYNNLAMRLQEKPNEAIKQFHQALLIDPDNATTKGNLNGILRYSGNDPNSFDVRLRLAEVSKKQNDLIGAYVEYQLALNIKEDLQVQQQLKEVCKQIRDSAEYCDYEKNLLDPEGSYSLLKNARMNYESGNNKAAIEDFDKLIKIDSQNSEYYARRAQAKYQAGDLDGAIIDFTEVIRLEPENIYAYDSRAFLKQKAGDYEGAKTDLLIKSDILKLQKKRKSKEHLLRNWLVKFWYPV